MQNLPKITIVTPSYNQGQFLRETIESVLGQEYPNLEYFVIDGGSTDNSVDIIREYKDRISWWISEKDGGQSEAINKGFKKATGEILGWVNSDDVLFPRCLRVVSDYYIKNNKPELIHSNMVLINKEGFIIRLLHIPRQTRFFMFKGVWSVSAPATFFSNTLMRKEGYLDTRYHISMDLDIWLRMIKAGGRICYISKYLGAFRCHDYSKTTMRINSLKRGHTQTCESDNIWDAALPKSTIFSRKVWRNIWRFYRFVKFDYVLGFIDTIFLRGKHWKKACCFAERL